MLAWPIAQEDTVIKCISRYSSSLGAFQPGDTIEQAALIAALLADSPASFAPVVAQADAKAVEDVPAPVAVVQKPARMVRRKA